MSLGGFYVVQNMPAGIIQGAARTEIICPDLITYRIIEYFVENILLFVVFSYLYSNISCSFIKTDRKSKYRGISMGNAIEISLLMYADDILLLGDTILEWQRKIRVLEELCENGGWK